MNFDKLLAIIVVIVLGFAATGNLETLQRWIWTSQAKMLQQSRTSTWGSPRFFPEAIKQSHEVKAIHSNE